MYVQVSMCYLTLQLINIFEVYFSLSSLLYNSTRRRLDGHLRVISEIPIKNFTKYIYFVKVPVKKFPRAC